MLLHRHVPSVNDKAHHSKRLGEWEARVEKSFCTGISVLSGKQAGQVQLAHRDHAVGINPEALAVIPWLLIIIFGSRIFPFWQSIIFSFSVTESDGDSRCALEPDKTRTGIKENNLYN